jgi:hypothetical protein
MQYDTQNETSQLGEEYLEMVYLSVQSALTVAETLKDLEVIEAQCASIARYRDADQIRAEVRLRMVRLGDQPDPDLLLDQRIRKRTKQQRIALVVFIVLTLAGGSLGVITVMSRSAQRQRYLSSLSQGMESVEHYAAKELAAAKSLFASKDYSRALKVLNLAKAKAVERKQQEMEVERVRMVAEAERERKTKELAEKRVADAAERQRKASEEELRQREEERAQKEEAKARRETEEKRLATEAEERLAHEELCLVQRAEKEVLPLLVRLQFKVADEILKMLQPRVKRGKGQEAFALLQEQASRLQNFHSALSVSAAGYLLARGDRIDASDAKEIIIAGKKTDWRDVYNTHPDWVNDIIEHRMLNEELFRGSRATEKADRLLDVALGLHLIYSASPSAQEKTKRLLAKLLKESPESADKVAKLFPAVTAEELSAVQYQPECQQCKERYCLQCLGQKSCKACAGHGSMVCRVCGGQGLIQGTSQAKCVRCGGAGERPGLDGPMKCLTCKGSGSLPRATYAPCSACDRRGRITCTACEGSRCCPMCKGTGVRSAACPGCGKKW